MLSFLFHANSKIFVYGNDTHAVAIGKKYLSHCYLAQSISKKLKIDESLKSMHRKDKHL